MSKRKRKDKRKNFGMVQMVKRVLKPQPKLYLAYGSNLNKRAMRSRCTDAIPAGVVLVKNAKLVFRGVLDLVCEPGFTTPCALWRISNKDEAALDRYEGHRDDGTGMYYKEMIDVGKGQTAICYFMNSDGVYPPSQYYVDTVRQGYRDFGLDEKVLDAAITRSFDDKAPTQREVDRRARQVATKHQRRLVTMPSSIAMRRLDKEIERAAKQAVQTRAALPWPKPAPKKMASSLRSWRFEDPHDYTIESDDAGFYLVNGQGEEFDLRRWRLLDSAKHELQRLIDDFEQHEQEQQEAAE